MTKPTSSCLAAPCKRDALFEIFPDRAPPAFGRAALLAAGCAMAMAVAPLLSSITPASARDRGQYANTSPELKAWFDSLRSGRGPCCSDADGSAVSDVDWESKDGQYRVRIEGQWVTVPDDAVITTPNRVGRTMVWPIYLEGRPVVRCFMPGSMT